MRVVWLMPVAIAIPLSFAGGFVFGHDDAVEQLTPVMEEATRELKKDIEQFQKDNETLEAQDVIIKNLLKRNKGCKPIL